MARIKGLYNIIALSEVCYSIIILMICRAYTFPYPNPGANFIKNINKHPSLNIASSQTFWDHSNISLSRILFAFGFSQKGLLRTENVPYPCVFGKVLRVFDSLE